MSHSVRVLAKLIAWVIGIRRILCQGGVDQWQRRESWIHRQQQQQPSVNNIGAWIWMICISMMEDPAGHPGGREPKKEKKNGHHPSRREKKKEKKREDGPQPPLEVGSKMECAGPKVDQRAPPPYQMVVVTSLSTLIRWNFFLYFFAALRDFERNFSLLLFRCFERWLHCGFYFFSSDSGPMMITTSQGKRSKPLICSRVYLFSPRYREKKTNPNKYKKERHLLLLIH